MTLPYGSPYDHKTMLAPSPETELPPLAQTAWQKELLALFRQRELTYAHVAAALGVIRRVPRTQGEWAKLWKMADLHRDLSVEEIEDVFRPLAAAPRRKKARKKQAKSVDRAMLDLANRPEALGWTATEWQVALGGKYSTDDVKRSKIWKGIMVTHAANKAARQKKKVRQN